MKPRLLISGIIILIGSLMYAQSMIGLAKVEVIEQMKKEHRKFRKDDSVVKQRFNYLKYVNGMKTKTWIIYFTEEDICKISKLVCDYGDFDDMVEELNSKYDNISENLWEYMSGKDTIQVELIKKEWYFSIRETRKQATGGKS